MTVKEMLSRMDSDELSTWRAFYNLDPFDSRRQDLQGAIIASTIYNSMRKKGRAKNVADFMPDFTHGKKSQAALNAKIMETFKSLNIKSS